MGNVPGNVPGEITHFKNERAVSTTFGLTGGDSYVDILTIEAPPNPDQVVIEARQKIYEAQLAASDLVAALVQVNLARQAVASAADATERGLAQSALSTAQGNLVSKRTNARDTAKAASEQISQSGVVVFRWAIQEDSGFATKSLFNMSGESTKGKSGYTIAAGWRECTLVVGSDINELEVNFESYWDWFVMKWGWLPWIGQCVKGKYARITTRSIQTRAVAFLQDELSLKELKASIQASVKDLGSTAAALEAIDSVEVELAFMRAYNLTTEGILANCDRKHLKGIVDKINSQDLDSDFKNWLTLVAIDANYHDLRGLIKVGQVYKEARAVPIRDASESDFEAIRALTPVDSTLAE